MAVTKVTAIDVDIGTNLQYSIVGGVDSKFFRIDALTGAVSFKAAPDFESAKDVGQDNVYDIVVRASDGQLIDTQAIAVKVIDVGNELLVGTAQVDTLIGAGGNDTLRGRAANDILLGNGGNDVLDGGAGADRMEGGAGDDQYVVDNAGDLVIEAVGGGLDTVTSSLSYVLTATVENATLIGSANLSARGSGRGNTLIGNAGDNLLTGLGGNDILHGGAGGDTLKGGLGKDMLAGGRGRDFFVFDSRASTVNVDRIMDFNGSENDKIQLSKSGFAAFVQEGALGADQFHAADGANSAHDGSDRVIYDTASGKLYYDSDGAGGASSALIAVLGSENHPTLIYSDIQIIA